MNAALEVFGISVKEVARRLGVSVSHIYGLAATDETFPKPRKVGRATRYDRRDVRTWFDTTRVEGRAVRIVAGKKRLHAT